MSKSMKWYMHSAIAIAIMFFVRFIPAPDPITPLGMTVLGIFLGAIYAWCFVDLVWPSLIALILLGFTEWTTPTAAWNTLISNGTVGLCLWLMISVGILRTSGLINWLAQWSITRSWTKGKPWVLFHVVVLSGAACSAIVGGIATVVLFFALVSTICEEVGYKKGDSMAAFFFFAVGFYSTIGNMLMPFHTAIIANFGFMAAGSNGAFDGSFDYVSYVIFAFVTLAAVYITTFLFFRYVLNPDTSLLKNYDPEKNKLMKMTKEQKISLTLFAALFLLFMGPSIFPKGTIFFTFCSKLGTVGSAILIIAIACLIHIDGKPFTSFKTLVSDNVLWQVLLMFGTAVTISACLNNPAAGVGLYIKGLLTPLFTGLGVYGFLMLFFGIAILLTNLINNTVVSALMLPVAYGFCMELGINPVAFTACFIMFVDYAFLLPSSSPCGALMHSNSDWLPKKFLYTYGSIALIITFAISILVGWPVANMVF